MHVVSVADGFYLRLLWDILKNQRLKLCVSMKNRHRNVGKYNCESCGKVSFSKANAEMHAASHREEKRLTCMNCGKKFASQTYLNRHIRREMGIGEINSTVEHATGNSAKK